MDQLTFGVEEEFALLDPLTLTTVDVASRAVADLSRTHPGHVGNEFFESQVEYSSPIFTTTTSARLDLHRFRAELAQWAGEHDVIAVSSGTPYRTASRSGLHAAERYERIAADVAGLVPDHQINGMHVHVAITDREHGVRASDGLRPWLPVLLALSANSPFWQGRDTGYVSWRAVHGRRWTTHGIPPHFGDVATHDATLDFLTGIGATSDPGTVNWNVRVSASHPTLETRVCDAQLDVDATVALAAIIRALVMVAQRSPAVAEPAPGAWDAALWHAARYGLSGTLVDPVSGSLAPARLAVDSLCAHVAAALDQLGDRRLVDTFLRRVLREGPGAVAQWRAARHSTAALATLYRDSLAEDPNRALSAGRIVR